MERSAHLRAGAGRGIPGLRRDVAATAVGANRGYFRGWTGRAGRARRQDGGARRHPAFARAIFEFRVELGGRRARDISDVDCYAAPLPGQRDSNAGALRDRDLDSLRGAFVACAFQRCGSVVVFERFRPCAALKRASASSALDSIAISIKKLSGYCGVFFFPNKPPRALAAAPVVPPPGTAPLAALTAIDFASGITSGFDVVPCTINGIPLLEPPPPPPPAKAPIAPPNLPPPAPAAPAMPVSPLATPERFASSLKLSCPAALTVPLPVTVPSDGITRFKLSIFVPDGSLRTVALSVWISVSEPPPPLPPPPSPGIDPSAPSFDFKLNPASFAFDRFIGPEITSLSAGPLTVRFAVSAPPCSFDPDGTPTPTAGKKPSKSDTGMACAFNRISNLARSVAVL